jgi:hypothetical protein
MTFHFLERLPPSLLFYSVSVNANSMVRLIGLAFLMVHPVEEISSMDFMKHVEVFYFYGPALDILLLTYIHTYLPLTLYPRRGSRGISDIAPRSPRFTKISQL